MAEQMSSHKVGLTHPRLHAFVFRFDRWLQRYYSVVEFSDRPDCIFRAQVETLRHALPLPDGGQLPAGRRVLTLHLWNEHVPLMPANGATLAWARRMSHCLDLSLRELARWLSARADLTDIALIRAQSVFGTAEQARQVAWITQRYGFEKVPEPRPSVGERLHRLGENVLISLMVLARNPIAFRLDSLRRERVTIVMPRTLLASHYGPAKTV